MTAKWKTRVGKHPASVERTPGLGYVATPHAAPNSRLASVPVGTSALPLRGIREVQHDGR